MTSTCELRSSSSGSWDEGSGSYGDTPGALVYAGKFNIPAGAAVSAVSAGETGWALGRFLAKFPLDAPLSVGLVGVVTSCDFNPRLVGLKFTITGLPPRAHPVHQPAECEGLAR